MAEPTAHDRLIHTVWLDGEGRTKVGGQLHAQPSMQHHACHIHEEAHEGVQQAACSQEGHVAAGCVATRCPSQLLCSLAELAKLQRSALRQANSCVGASQGVAQQGMGCV